MGPLLSAALLAAALAPWFEARAWRVPLRYVPLARMARTFLSTLVLTGLAGGAFWLVLVQAGAEARLTVLTAAALAWATGVTLALLAAGAGSAWGGALTGAAFATATGAGLATSVWASALLRQSRAGARVVAAVLVLGAAIVSVRAFPQLLGGANEGAACHSDTGAVRAAPVARRP